MTTRGNPSLFVFVFVVVDVVVVVVHKQTHIPMQSTVMQPFLSLLSHPLLRLTQTV